jgi:cyclopropane fatty-acyl-phospholipid synthase-like methyltransferase
MSVKILDIGSGYGSLAETIFESIAEKEIVRMDADPEKKPDILHDITTPLPEELRGQFDLVLASHVMEHIGRDKVVDAFRHAISAVKNMGEVWILVPSLEWAANEIINLRDGLHVQGTIFGGQLDPFDVHQCGFTLASLRQMVELCGLIVRKAYQSPCTITVGGTEYGSLQNIVIGARYDGMNDPADAIEAA